VKCNTTALATTTAAITALTPPHPPLTPPPTALAPPPITPPLATIPTRKKVIKRGVTTALTRNTSPTTAITGKRDDTGKSWIINVQIIYLFFFFFYIYYSLL
jgi:hypothetical protein